MYYFPHFSPEKPGMPILGYFGVVGTVLLGLLFLADATIPRNEHLSFVSSVEGLPAAYKGEPAHMPAAALHIAPPPAVVETTGSGPGLSANAVPASEAPKPTVAAAPLMQEAARPAKRMVVRKRQREFREDRFGALGRQDFGFARETFSREPSWRDSWASGAFQQREPQNHRSSWRSGSDFGNFR